METQTLGVSHKARKSGGPSTHAPDSPAPDQEERVPTGQDQRRKQMGHAGCSKEGGAQGHDEALSRNPSHMLPQGLALAPALPTPTGWVTLTNPSPFLRLICKTEKITESTDVRLQKLNETICVQLEGSSYLFPDYLIYLIKKCIHFIIRFPK